MPGFSVFSCLWSLGIFLHLCTHAAWFDTWLHLLLAASCLLATLLPSSTIAAAAVNGFLLAVFLLETPDTPNHLVLFAVVSASVLASLVSCCLAARSLRVDRARWLETFAPALRAEVLVLYFFAVLHKLNWDYFDPQLSCAASIVRFSAPGWLSGPLLQFEGVRWLLIFGSLATELAVPLLLLGRRTRPFGLVLGVCFHTFLGAEFPAFSTALFALYALFVPASLWQRMADRLQGRGGLAGLLLVGPFLFAQLFAYARWLRVESEVPPAFAVPLYSAVLALWGFSLLLALAWVLVPEGRWRQVRGVAPGRGVRPWLWGFPALLLLNGFSPYLGLRTVPTFSMFSNLRTEGAENNHLFMPDTALRLASYQEDLVEIEATNVPVLRRQVRTRSLITWYTLRRIVQRVAATGGVGIHVNYARRGVHREVTHAENDPELMQPPSWLERKLLRFRPVYRFRGCSW